MRERSPGSSLWSCFHAVQVGLASVLADGCRETLDAAMSLMGPEEISHLEDEARVIQHNVRAWLLRKR